MNTRKRFAGMCTGIVLLIVLGAYLLVPTSVLLHRYPGKDEFSAMFCNCWLSANGNLDIQHVRSLPTEFAPPEHILPNWVCSRDRVKEWWRLKRQTIRISTGFPSNRIEMFQDSASLDGRLILWHVIDNKVVDCTIVTDGHSTQIDVCSFMNAANEWLFFLKTLSNKEVQ